MVTTVKQALQNFVELNEALQEAVEDLKRVAKEESSKRMQEYIENEEFETASEILAELSDFTKIEFESNAEKTYAYAQKMIDRQPLYEEVDEYPVALEVEVESDQIQKDELSVSVVKEEEKLDNDEKELLKLLGETGISRQKDSSLIHMDIIENLIIKGFVEAEDIKMNDKTIMVFELTSEGEEMYEVLCGVEPKESMLSELRSKYNDVQKGYFLIDIEAALKSRNYAVEDISSNQVEITKDNRSSYLTLDFGTYSDSEYMKILNRKNQLKNIGFICLDNKKLKHAKAITQKWANQNKNKCKFLTVNFTTIEKIENSPQVFETLSF